MNSFFHEKGTKNEQKWAKRYNSLAYTKVFAIFFRTRQHLLFIVAPERKT